MSPQEFVEALRARGVEVSVKGNRLRLDPGATWRHLTVDEAQCIAANRAAIKVLADEPFPPPVPRAPTPERAPERATPELAPELTPERAPEPPPPKPRVYSVDCERFVTAQDLRDAGVVGTDRAAYERAEVWLRNQVRERQTKYATGEMFESLRRHQTHGGYL